MEIRIAVFDPLSSNMSYEEYEQRANYAYQNSAAHPLVLLPWGQVVQLHECGMLSGDENTSIDNSLGHEMIVLAMVKHYIPHVQNYHEAHHYLRMWIYADDHLFACNKTVFDFSPFELRRSFYDRCGFILKKEDDKVQGTLPGLKFLGATILDNHGFYVPGYSVTRCLSSVVYKSRSLEPSQYYAKVYSLALLIYFSDRTKFDLLCDYLRFLLKKFNATGATWLRRLALSEEFEKTLGSSLKLSMPIVPDDLFAESFWMGLESGSVYLPLSLPGVMNRKNVQKLKKLQRQEDKIIKPVSNGKKASQGKSSSKATKRNTRRSRRRP